MELETILTLKDTVAAQAAEIERLEILNVALIEFYNSIPVKFLRDMTSTPMRKIDNAVAAVELAFNGENI